MWRGPSKQSQVKDAFDRAPRRLDTTTIGYTNQGNLGHKLGFKGKHSPSSHDEVFDAEFADYDHDICPYAQCAPEQGGRMRPKESKDTFLKVGDGECKGPHCGQSGGHSEHCKGDHKGSCEEGHGAGGGCKSGERNGACKRENSAVSASKMSAFKAQRRIFGRELVGRAGLAIGFVGLQAAYGGELAAACGLIV